MEEAQELTVTNTGQPIAATIDPADTYDDAQLITPTPPAAVTVTITPAE